jgi:hypothetical protein
MIKSGRNPRLGVDEPGVLTLDYSVAVGNTKVCLGGPMTAITRRLISAVLGLAAPLAVVLSGGRTSRRPSELSSGPVEHIGATESFGRELRALRNVQVSPELVSDIEQELRWGQIWHDFERSMQAEVDRIFAPALALAECEDFDDLRELIGLADATELALA